MTRARSIGELVVAGDRACARGDVPELGAVAARLAASFSEPLHCDLLSLAELCASEPERAVERWTRLHDELFPIVNHEAR